MGRASNAESRAAVAVAAMFLANGAVFANYLPRLPEVRDRLGVDNAVLGLAAMGAGLGGLIGSAASPWLQRRLGTRTTVIISGVLLSCGLPLLALAPTPFALGAVLVMMGAFDVVTDLAMNAEGVAVQHRLRRSIMNRLHGMWSLGFVLGTAIASGVAAAEVRLTVHFVGAAVVLAGTALVAGRAFLGARQPEHEHGSQQQARSRVASRATVAIAAAALGASLIEGTGNEWASIVMRDVFSLGDGSVGIAGFAFATAMLVGRMSGDHALDRFGQHRLLGGALALVAVGVAMVATVGAWPLAVAGYAVWGLGTSVLFPQIYFLAGTAPGLAPAVGLAVMTVSQRFGFLVVPLVVGSSAEAIGLRWTLVTFVGAAVATIAVARSRLDVREAPAVISPIANQR
jgi:predicted MFS family arabinose efflux permease